MSTGLYETQSLRIDPPKITPNSVWLYHSNNGLKKNKALRTFEVPLLLTVLLWTSYPVFNLFGMAVMYQFGIKATDYEAGYRSAVRMDYLPNVDKVSVTKVGPFGVLYNTLWDPQDFEVVDIQDTYYQGSLIRTVLLERQQTHFPKTDLPQQKIRGTFVLRKVGFLERRGNRPSQSQPV